MMYRKNMLVWVLLALSVAGMAQSNKKERRNKPLKILLVSDLNDSYGSVTYSREVHDMVSRIKTIQPDMILCGGDMVAGQKASLTPEQIHAMWRGFDTAVFQPVQQLQIPFGFTLGNHDASPGYANDRAAATAYWSGNKANVHLSFVDDTYFPYYFSYIKNNVFFISWDASSAVIPDSIQQWMQTQLALSIARKARARIVLGHLPLYAIVAAKNKAGEVLNAADKTLAFLQANKVDMYISGHQHAYFPATKEKVMLLNSGCLGGGPRPLLGHDAPAQKAYVILEIRKRKKKRKIQISGYTAQQERISLESLPASVTGFNGTIQRMEME